MNWWFRYLRCSPQVGSLVDIGKFSAVIGCLGCDVLMKDCWGNGLQEMHVMDGLVYFVKSLQMTVCKYFNTVY